MRVADTRKYAMIHLGKDFTVSFNEEIMAEEVDLKSISSVFATAAIDAGNTTVYAYRLEYSQLLSYG